MNTAVAEKSDDLLSERSAWRTSDQSRSSQIVRTSRTAWVTCVRPPRSRSAIRLASSRTHPAVSDLWVQVSLDYKQRMQQLFFPRRDPVRRKSTQSNCLHGTTFHYLAPDQSGSC